MILLDTDHLSLLQVRDAPAAFALHTRLEASPDAVVTTVITRLLPTSPRESRFSIAYSHPYESNPMTWRAT
jgi:hypothetical protein